MLTQCHKSLCRSIFRLLHIWLKSYNNVICSTLFTHTGLIRPTFTSIWFSTYRVRVPRTSINRVRCCVSFLNWFQIELNHRLAPIHFHVCTKPFRPPPFSNFILCLSALLPQNWRQNTYNYIIAFALPGLYRYFREYLYASGELKGACVS